VDEDDNNVLACGGGHRIDRRQEEGDERLVRLCL
ncbi:hypothetical protein Tco_1356161, partial [Tanacetum coccineum]